MLAVAGFLTACSQQPKPSFMNTPPPNPKAPMAWLSEGSMSNKMQLQYAEAMQNAGLFNFVTEDFSEEQIEKAVEIRIKYTEEKGKYNRIPILRLKTEILEEGMVKSKFSLIEESNEILYNQRNRNREINYRQNVLLQRFLEELKRITGKEKDVSCNG
jgi:ribosomal protein S18